MCSSVLVVAEPWPTTLTETFNMGSRLLVSLEGSCQAAELNWMGLARGMGVSGPCERHGQWPPPAAAVPNPIISAPALISLSSLFISAWLRIFYIHMASAGEGLPWLVACCVSVPEFRAGLLPK